MRVALVHVSDEAWITRVDTLTPERPVGSAEEARQRLRAEGYTEAWAFRGEVGQQLLVFVEDEQQAVENPLHAELIALRVEVKTLKVERETERTRRLERLVQAHNLLLEGEHDHHEIAHCQCDLAHAWRLAKDASTSAAGKSV